MDAIRQFTIDDETLENVDVAGFDQFISQVYKRPDYAKQLRGSGFLVFPKYDDDPREGYEVEEIRTYVQRLDRAFPFFLYFLHNEAFLFWFACLMPLTHTERQGGKIGVSIDPDVLVPLLAARIGAVYAFCEKMQDDSGPVIVDILKAFPSEVAILTIDLLKSDKADSEAKAVNLGSNGVQWVRGMQASGYTTDQILDVIQDVLPEEQTLVFNWREQLRAEIEKLD